MDVLVACHNEAEDGPLFLFYPPRFDTPVRSELDFVDPYTSNRKWSDYGPESKTMIWTQYCPIYAPFSRESPNGYSVFINLFDDGWKILKPGGTIVIPLGHDFLEKGMSTEKALDNFKTFLKRLLAKKHPWESSVVRREDMPFIVSAPFEDEVYNRFVVFKKPMEMNNTRKTRKSRRGRGRSRRR